MMTLNNYLLKSTLWTVCFFVLWWNVTPILMPFAASIVSPMLNHSFNSHYGAQIEMDGSEWILATTLYLNRPQDGRLKAWYAKIGNLTQYTMGLPLLLGFFVAVKGFRYKHLLIATFILSGGIIFMMWTKASLFIWYLLVDNSVEYIETYPGYYQQVKSYPAEVYDFFVIIHATLVYIFIFFLPILLAYWFNRDFYHRLLTKK